MLNCPERGVSDSATLEGYFDSRTTKKLATSETRAHQKTRVKWVGLGVGGRGRGGGGVNRVGKHEKLRI